MRTVKDLLRKAEHFRGNALTSPAAYRLYVFVPWEDIPEDIKPHFKEDAKDNWNNELSTDGLEADIELQIVTILNELAKRNTVQALMLIPLLFADLYILGHKTGELEGHYSNIVNTYSADYHFDRLIADLDFLNGVEKIFNKILSRTKIETEFDLSKAVNDIRLYLEKQVDTEVNTQGLSQSIDEAIAKYDEITGGDLISEIDTGEDLLADLDNEEVDKDVQ